MEYIIDAVLREEPEKLFRSAPVFQHRRIRGCSAVVGSGYYMEERNLRRTQGKIF